MTLLVRDEEDILRENIEYHLSQGVDFIVATDNCSVDATMDILKAYEKAGVLRYLYEPSDDYSQHAWVTRMARMACLDHGADWIINNDADEFWWPLHGTLKENFKALGPDVSIVSVKRFDFVPVEDSRLPFYERMVYKKQVSLNALGKPLPPKVAHRASPNVEVAQGNHKVTGIENPIMRSGLMEIFHYPIRSLKQLENKIVKGGAAYERNRELPKEVGGTWRHLYEEYKSSNGLGRYYETNFYRGRRLNDALQSGDLVQDERLAKYFSGAGIIRRE